MSAPQGIQTGVANTAGRKDNPDKKKKGHGRHDAGRTSTTTSDQSGAGKGRAGFDGEVKRRNDESAEGPCSGHG